MSNAALTVVLTVLPLAMIAGGVILFAVRLRRQRARARLAQHLGSLDLGPERMPAQTTPPAEPSLPGPSTPSRRADRTAAPTPGSAFVSMPVVHDPGRADHTGDHTGGGRHSNHDTGSTDTGGTDTGGWFGGGGYDGGSSGGGFGGGGFDAGGGGGF